MADASTLARPYAKAAFDYAKEQHVVADWQSYLAVLRAIVSDAAMAEVIHDPTTDVAAKVKLLGDLYQQIAQRNDNVFQTLDAALSGDASNEAINAQSAPAPASNDTALSPAFGNFLQQLAEHERLSLLPNIAELFDDLKADDAEEIHAYVTSAYPLTAEQQALIESRLRRNAGQVVLHVSVDPALIGGAIIKIGDKVVDDSVRGKLQQLKLQLTA